MEELKLISLDFSVLSKEVIEVLLLDSTVEPSLFEEIAKKNIHRPEILRYLLSHPKTPETTRQLVARILQVLVPKTAPSETTTAETPSKKTPGEHGAETLLQRIQKLKVGERIQLALRGSREIRTILLRDSTKEVMLTVLENPKITVSEIEIIAKQKSSPEEAIRAIAKNREWLKKYSILHSLVSNPKTPVAIALKHIYSLRAKDLSLIEKNKNIPEAIRAAAKKILSARKQS